MLRSIAKAAGAGGFAAIHSALRFSSSNASAEPKIYRSWYPSLLDKIDAEPSLYKYTIDHMKAVDPNKIGSIQAETGKTYTYGELLATTEHMAQILYHAAGIRQGDVVSISFPNVCIYGPMVYGTLRLGAVVSTVNVVSDPATLAYHFKTNKCKVVLAMKYFRKPMEAAADIYEKETGKKLLVLYPEDLLKLKDTPAIPADYDAFKGATANDTVYIPFSSGTTGLPKGVQLTNRNLIANTEQAAVMLNSNKDFVSVTVLPFFHIYGFMGCLQVPLCTGAVQIVMMRYNVKTYVRVTEKYRATVNLVAPPIIISLLNHPELLKKHDLSSLVYMRSGAAPLGPEVEAACAKEFPGCSIAQGYGLTEMSPLVSQAPELEAAKSCGYPAPPPGASGVLAPDTELRIVRIDDSQQSGADKSAGVDCAQGEEGEIWTRGPQMMKGYLNQSDTDMVMQDGWFRTGDIGKYDEKTGYLTVTDRLKELIKYKSFQVSPASLEAIILQHPWVADCVVVGVPDPLDSTFENPRGLIVLKRDLSEASRLSAGDSVARFVMARNAPTQRLHGGVRVVTHIPRNASNKIMRRQVRADEVAFMSGEIGGGEPSRPMLSAWRTVSASVREPIVNGWGMFKFWLASR